MRGIIEIVIAITAIFGGGHLALQGALFQIKKVAAEKIQEQSSTRLGDYTRKMTGTDTGL